MFFPYTEGTSTTKRKDVLRKQQRQEEERK